MPLKTPEQYVDSLRALKIRAYVGGERVEGSVVDHPLVAPHVNTDRVPRALLARNRTPHRKRDASIHRQPHPRLRCPRRVVRLRAEDPIDLERETLGDEKPLPRPYARAALSASERRARETFRRDW